MSQVFSPGEMKIYETVDSVEDNFQLVAPASGLHRICFINKEPLSETVDFNYVVGHIHQEADPAASGHLQQVIAFLQNIADDVKLIQQDQAYFRSKGARRRKSKFKPYLNIILKATPHCGYLNESVFAIAYFEQVVCCS